MNAIPTASARRENRWRSAGLLIALTTLLTALPAWGITEISSDVRATVTTGLSISTLEDPSVGSSPYDCGEVKEWLDADYVAGACKSWSFSGSGWYDGDSNECWIRSDGGDNLSITSSVSDEIIAIHMAGDSNDGEAELYVDGTLFATLDGYNASPPADYAQVIVGCIGDATHSIEVRGTGVSPGAGTDDDVALLGAAVCAFKVEAGTEVTCNDCADNDSDTDIDCADSDCSGFSGCESGTELTCDDYFDNDGDGDIDCADENCSGDPACVTQMGAPNPVLLAALLLVTALCVITWRERQRRAAAW